MICRAVIVTHTYLFFLITQYVSRFTNSFTTDIRKCTSPSDSVKGFVMVQLNSPELEHLASLLKKYDLQSTVAQLAGLLTVPSLQANTIRIEILVHLAVVHCRGRRKPSLMQIGRWLNRQFDKTHITVLEEPVEDVFVTNVETPHGNRRIFEGIWNSNDYYVQTAIDVLIGSTTPQECQNLLVPAFALLKLSDFVAERVGLERWHVEPSTPRSNIRLAPALGGQSEHAQ